MKIPWNELPAEGLEYTFSPREPWAEAAAREVLEASPLRLQGVLRLDRVGPGVQACGELSVTVPARCARCAAAVHLDIETSFSLYYERPPEDPPEEKALERDELDVGYLPGGEIPLDLVLSEAIALEVPTRIRCGDAGVERQEPGECTVPGNDDSEEEPVDPRFAVLQDLDLH